ncbi:MAG: helix-turn-helix domain-containing protein [Dehalococcoidia bacterium]
MHTQTLPSRATSTRRWNAQSAPRPLSSYPIFLLRPPYEERNLRAALPDLDRADVPPGSIAGVMVSRPVDDPDAIRKLVRDLSKRIPACPVVMLLQMPPEEGLLVATRLAPLQFRAIVPIGAGMSPLLREVLTDPAMLSRDVVDWLQLRHIRLNPNQTDLLESIFTAAPHYPDLTTLLDHYRIPQSSARFRLRKRGLPSPNRWFQLARAIHAALRLQAKPERSVAAVAHQLGFADHSALAHLLRRSLHVTANQVRGTLGWEWLLDRWMNSIRSSIR